ncbi:MAG: HTTM domain-containing protein [Saprospiraceae bacterium]|nr:HTTM domain-containing protein [Saprospiraceae bacterium]
MSRLFQPLNIASLVFFRVAFGLLGFADVLGTWLYYHLHEGAFQPGKFRFAYLGFEWVQPLPEPWMSACFILLLLSALGIIVGWRYRANAIIFALGFTWLFLLEKAHYLNHGYLFCWISFLMIILPAHRCCSFDARRNPVLHSDVAPAWCVWILPFLMAVVYCYGGIAKLNPDWLRGVPLTTWLQQKAGMPVVGAALDWPGTAFIMAYGGLLFDLTAPFGLLFRRTRVFVFVLGIGFHLVNTLIFQIGIFPALSICLTALFFPPDFPVVWSRKLPARMKLFKFPDIAPEASDTGADYWQFGLRRRKWILAALMLVVCAHLLIPLRLYLFKGPAAWTEEGHRYAWRMMLRSKQGHGHFVVKDLDTGDSEIVRPSKHLSNRQNRKLYAHPDMIWQFARYLKASGQATGKNVAVYANIQTKLNDRPYQTFIDPAIDLGSMKWQHFQAASWIMPLEKK